MPLVDWNARLPLNRADAAAGLRTDDRVEAAIAGNALWFRSTRAGELDAIRDRVPLAEFFTPAGEAIRPVGSRLPTETVPDLRWQPIDRVLGVSLPPERPASASPAAVRLTLVADDTPRPIGGVLTTTSPLLDAVSTLPAARFRSQRFATDGDAAIVLGTPPLPVLGTGLVVADRVAVAAGYRLHPVDDPATVRDLCDAGDGFVLATPERFEVLPGEVFVPLSRASVRATAGARG